MMGESLVYVINLWEPEAECFVCDTVTTLRQGIARYEDMIVPEDYEGEWGGAAVCKRCYYLVCGMQAKHPGEILNVHDVRSLIEEPQHG